MKQRSKQTTEKEIINKIEDKLRAFIIKTVTDNIRMHGQIALEIKNHMPDQEQSAQSLQGRQP